LGKLKAVLITQLLIVEGTQAWTKEEAKELMVNETSLPLRKVMVNAHNPLEAMGRCNLVLQMGRIRCKI
jgi:hypothetical protein